MNRYPTQKSHFEGKTYSTGMASDNGPPDSSSSFCEEYPFPLDSSKELSRRFAILQYSLDEFPQIDSYAKVGQIDYIKQLLHSCAELLLLYPDLVNDLKGFLTLRIPKILAIVIDHLLPQFVGDNGTNLLLVSKTYRLLQVVYYVVDQFAIETNVALTNEVLAKTYGFLRQETFWRSSYPQQVIELILTHSKPKRGMIGLFEGVFWIHKPDNDTYLHLFKLYFSNYIPNPEEKDQEGLDQHIVGICELLDKHISEEEKLEQPYIEAALALHDFQLRRFNSATVVHHDKVTTIKSRATSYKALRKERDRLKKLAQLPNTRNRQVSEESELFSSELGKENAPNVFRRVSKSAFVNDENEDPETDDELQNPELYTLTEIRDTFNLEKYQVLHKNQKHLSFHNYDTTPKCVIIKSPRLIVKNSPTVTKMRLRDRFRSFFRLSLHKHPL